jgi:hypothetical protein
MKTFNFIIIFLFIIGTIIVTREITLRMYKVPDTLSVIPSPYIEETLTDNFRKLFLEKSPWVGNLQSVPYTPKKEVNFNLNSDKYDYMVEQNIAKVDSE